MDTDDLDVNDLIGQLRALVESARSMPMSASAVINRAEALDLVARLEKAVPTAFADQDKLFAERDEVLSRAREEAAEILATAHRQGTELVGETDVFKLAKQEAEELRRETDDYVDTRLATFEVTLTKTLAAVTRGRARLQGRTHFDDLSETARGPDGSDHDGDVAGLTMPDELRRDASEQAG
jgi:cell division septum initiation protein DivIVA